MFIFEYFTLVTIFTIIPQLQCAPFVFDDDDDDKINYNEELDKKYKNRKKPCQRNEEGRTFFLLNLSYVNNNYNCGGGNHPQAGITGINKPAHHKPFGHKPHHHNHHGGNKPSKPVQVNNKPVDVEHDPIDDSTPDTNQKPFRPFQTFVQNHSQGVGILNTLFNGLFDSGTTQTPSSVVIPVHEIQEEDPSTSSPKWKPDLSQFNSKRLYKSVDRYYRPFVDFF